MIVNKKQKSMTLVELLVAITIILVLSGLILPNYRAVQKEFALFRESHKIAQNIRMVEQGALSSECSSCQISFDISHPTSYEVLGKTVNLEKFVKISSLIPSPLTIQFLPPNPNVLINGNSKPPPDEAVIEITNGIHSKRIKVNYTGRIEIE